MFYRDTGRLALWSFVCGVLCLWPALLGNGIFVYFDTFGYEAAGENALRLLGEVIAPEVAAPPGDGASSTVSKVEAGSPNSLRSLSWSLSLAMVGGLPLGALLLAAAQTGLTLFVLSLLLPERPDTRIVIFGAAGLGVATGLPWYAAYAMPDLLGALLIGSYAVLLARWEETSWGLRLVLTLASLFAILGHYGHLPLAAVLCVACIVAAAWQRRASMAFAAAVLSPLLLAVMTNLAISFALAAMSAPSEPEEPASVEETAETSRPADALDLTPGRLPILLARSIEDGPARWHLQVACETDLYRSCAFLDTRLETVGDFLWSDRGVSGLSRAERAVLRSEELQIVRDAALAHPVAQATAILRNALRQFGTVGIDEHIPKPPDEGRPSLADRAAVPALGWADAVIPVVTALAGIFVLGAWAIGAVATPIRGACAVIVLGLVVNALIFGGFSYPVDRYQGRVAWLLPAFLWIIALWTRRTIAGTATRKN